MPLCCASARRANWPLRWPLIFGIMLVCGGLLRLHSYVEVSTRGISACQSSLFKFPAKNHKDYVQYNGTVPQLKRFTACVWLRPEEIGVADSYGVMSYCAIGSERCGTALILLSNSKTAVTIFEEKRPYKFDSTTKVRQWTHVCIVMSGIVSQYYINGSLYSVSTNVISKDIPKGGVLIIGNVQDNKIDGRSPGDPMNGARGYFGEMKGFQLWNKQLTKNDIEDAFKSDGCSCDGDSVVNFNERNSVIKGNVTPFWNSPCP